MTELGKKEIIKRATVCLHVKKGGGGTESLGVTDWWLTFSNRLRGRLDSPSFSCPRKIQTPAPNRGPRSNLLKPVGGTVETLSRAMIFQRTLNRPSGVALFVHMVLELHLVIQAAYSQGHLSNMDTRTRYRNL